MAAGRGVLAHSTRDKHFIVRFDGTLEEKWTDHGMETIYRNAREVEGRCI